MKTFLEHISKDTIINDSNVVEEDDVIYKLAKKISKYPYKDNLYYHVTNCNNIDNILQHGLYGEEIWVTKSRPHPDYQNGCLLALNLDDYELKKDPRWVDEHNVFIVLNDIHKDDIVESFKQIPEIHDDREDILAEELSDLSIQEIYDIIKKYFVD